MGRREARRRDAATAALVGRELATVWSYVRGMLGDDDEAVAVTREVFRIAEAADADARAARVQLLVRARLACGDRDAEGDAVAHAGPADAGDDPGPRGRLTARVAALAPEEREALLLLDVLELDEAEAAEICEDAPAGVRARRHRAHTRLVADLLGGEP